MTAAQSRAKPGCQSYQSLTSVTLPPSLLSPPGLGVLEPEAAPAFHFYARRVNPDATDVIFFEAFTCWLRPLELKVEESVVSAPRVRGQGLGVRPLTQAPWLFRGRAGQAGRWRAELDHMDRMWARLCE